jgi:nitrous oxidase accessory protein
MIKSVLTFLISVTLTASIPASVFAKNIYVTASDNLQVSLDSAVDGDAVIISAGEYRGNFVVRQAITVTGQQGVKLNAKGKGHALVLENSNITVENLNIVNWGQDLTEQDSGIYTDKKSQNLIIRNNTLSGDGFGIWVQKSDNVKILNNNIIGNSALRSTDRGNGIQLSIVKNVLVEGNTISFSRDGLYVISSQQNVLKNNTMHDLRYGIHYMYSHSNQVIDNYAYNTRAGYALMSSRHLVVSGNKTENSEDYGFLINFITYSTITNNRIENVWTKPEHKAIGREGKGLFIYNSAYNTLSYNTIDTAEIGIHLTAGSENTKVYGNNFINNPVQVKYVSNKRQEWSFDGAGNFWSNYLGWDLNNDGKGDTVFEPNDGIDKMVWQYPEAKVLLDSPSVLLLRWVQKQFPVLKPGGVKDSFPLMQPVATPATPAASASHDTRVNGKTNHNLNNSNNLNNNHNLNKSSSEVVSVL